MLQHGVGQVCVVEDLIGSSLSIRLDQVDDDVDVAARRGAHHEIE